MARKPYTKKVKIIESAEEVAVVEQVAIKKTRAEKVAIDVPLDYELLQKENNTLQSVVALLQSELKINSESCICEDLKEKLKSSSKIIAGLENSLELLRKRAREKDEDREQELAFNHKFNILNVVLFTVNLGLASGFFYTLIG